MIRSPCSAGRRWLWPLLAVLALGAAHAGAAPQSGQVFKDWKVLCDEPEQAGAPTCYIFQDIALQTEGRSILWLAVGYRQGFDKPVGIFTVPLGTYLPIGVTLKIGEDPPLNIPIQHCLPNGCRARLLFDDRLLAAFKAGTQGLVTFEVGERQRKDVPISLLGFTAALQSLR